MDVSLVTQSVCDEKKKKNNKQHKSRENKEERWQCPNQMSTLAGWWSQKTNK
jgi:hypothetical protein